MVQLQSSSKQTKEDYMPAKGVSMRKIKTLLRLHFDCNLSQHKIAKSLSLSVGVVNKYLQMAKNLKLTWPLPQHLEDEQLLNNYLAVHKLQPTSDTHKASQSIDFALVRQELKRKGVTLQLLWEEHTKATSSTLSYSHFCYMYRNWRKTQPQSMRQTHKAGDKVFVDYAGQTVAITDPLSGEINTAQIFVGVLGASNYVYAEATWSQRLPDWIASHQRMFEFYGGVPALVVLDNLRSGVTKSCRYEPEINQTYADFIEYCGTAAMPTRPVKPKDKAKVENAVLIVSRWVLARLRHFKFTSLGELNIEIKKLLDILNRRPFKKMPGCRASLFNELEKPALRALPKYPYQFMEIKRARVHVDYHIELDHHYYSVPYQYISKEIMLHFNGQYVECRYQGQVIALHQRSYQKGQHTTVTEHMPKSHRKHAEWSPGRFLTWASQIGTATSGYVEHLLSSRPHPEQGYRSCLGLLSLAKRYGNERLEKACARAWQLGARSRKSVASILEHNMEDLPLPQELFKDPISHSNLRGKRYYH